MKITGLRVAALATVYLVMASLTFTGTLASWQYNEAFSHEFAGRHCRRDVAFAVFMSILPVPGWVISPFATGFYERGFSWRCRREG